jgi:NAD dependent epimerase/dehydratase family enzyme
MEKIRSLIVGATGLIGGEILKVLESQNQDISLLSRSALKE